MRWAQESNRAVAPILVREPIAVFIDGLLIGNHLCRNPNQLALAVDRRAAAVAVNDTGIGLNPIPEYVPAFDNTSIDSHRRAAFLGKADDEQIIHHFVLA